MTAEKPPSRRRASQARSKATVQRILDATTDLIAERPGEVTMTEIAQRADVVLGSLYQYFSDKSAIHRAILVQHNADVRIMLHHYIGNAENLTALINGIDAAFNEYYNLHQSDAFYNGIWSIVQTDADLQAIDVEDTLQNARYAQSVARRFLPKVSDDRLLAACALLFHLGLTTSRFARTVPSNLGREMPSLFAHVLQTTFDDME